MTLGPGAVEGPEAVLGAEFARDADWRRLDLRMLLVHPVNELIRFLPLVIGLFVVGSANSGDPWHYLGVAVPIAIGVIRFATTRFRISAGQIELRRGVLGRSVLTAPLDRVRTVELTASPIHRILGLEKVEIGTGSANRSHEGRVVLDSLGAAEARRLRHDLLAEADAGGRADPVALAATGGIAPAAADTILLRFDPSWVRFAPLTTTGLVIAVGALAASSQFIGNLAVDVADRTHVSDKVKSLPLVVVVPSALITFAVVISVLSMIGYLLSAWGFTLTRDDLRNAFHVRRGALTTRETSVDVDRLRGVEVHEPLGLRLAGGGRLNGIVTGLSRRAAGSTQFVPAAPRAVVLGVGEAVLGERGPLYVDLRPHGPRARRRRYTRALVPSLLLIGVGVAVSLGNAVWWPLLVTIPAPLVGALLARDRYARLGHALTPSYLVARWGSLRGRRDALRLDGIIGWNLRQSFFQRRAGLMSLTATTAAGQQSYEILDLPEDWAVALAVDAVPGLVEQFVVRSAS